MTFEYDSVQDLLGSLGEHILYILFIIAIFAVLLRIVTFLIERIVRNRAVFRRRFGYDPPDDQQRTETAIHVLTTTARGVFAIVTTIAVLSAIGINTTALLAGVSIASIAVGFGAQYLVKDYISGLLILMENQYRVGDDVQIGGVSGTVEDMSLRSTVIRDTSGAVHYVPNGEVRIASNRSKDFARLNLAIGVAYSTDLTKAMKIIDRVGQELAMDELWKDDILDPPYAVRLNDFTDSAVVLKVGGKTRPMRQWAVQGELRLRLKQAFDAEGIEMPFPQLVVHSRRIE